jgi:hypothetical protein
MLHDDGLSSGPESWCIIVIVVRSFCYGEGRDHGTDGDIQQDRINEC